MQLTQSGDDDVYVPHERNPEAWLLAKMHLMSADGLYHEMAVHLLQCHLSLEVLGCPRHPNPDPDPNPNPNLNPPPRLLPLTLHFSLRAHHRLLAEAPSREQRRRQ